MKVYKTLFLSLTLVIFFSACSYNNTEDTNSEVNEPQEYILEKEKNDQLQQEIRVITEGLNQLDEENTNLKKQLKKSKNINQELETELSNLAATVKSTSREITKDTVRKLILNHLQEIEEYMVGYQYCVYEGDKVFTVELFSPEPGTDDRAAMLLQQFEVNAETGFFTEVEPDSPGRKENCLNGYDVFN